MNIRVPPLYGLVLAGGQSRRLGRDKAAVTTTDGDTLLARAFALLTSRCEQVLVSVRETPASGSLRAGFPYLVDELSVAGPAAGIVTALKHTPLAAWLVVACDLPTLDGATLDHLIAQRDPERPATAYLDPATELPEPLCAIYEPAMKSVVAAELDADIRCPRKILIRLGRGLNAVDQTRPGALFNLNTREDYRHWRQTRAAS